MRDPYKNLPLYDRIGVAAYLTVKRARGIAVAVHAVPQRVRDRLELWIRS